MIASSSYCASNSIPEDTPRAAGSQTLTASATDHAGNTGNSSTSFTVTVTAGALCQLTSQQAGTLSTLAVAL